MSILSLSFLVNLVAVIAGGVTGSLFRGRLRIGAQQLTVRAIGLVMLAVGAFGFMYAAFPFNAEGAGIVGFVLIIVALPIGWLLGQTWRVERLFDQAAGLLLDFAHPASDTKKTAKNARGAEPTEVRAHSLDNLIPLSVYNLPSARSGHRFADGFAIASVYLITTSLTLHGLVTAGLVGTELLYWKSLLDFIVMSALATVYGTGVPNAALTFVITVALIDIAGGAWDSMKTGLVNQYDALKETYSGHTKALAVIKELPGELDALFTDSLDKMVRQLAVIGTAVTLSLGLCLGTDRKWKPENLLPAVLVPMLYYGIVVLAKIVEAAFLSADAAKLATLLNLL